MIREKAVDLGRLIGQSADYKEIQRAREALDGVSEIRAQMQRLEILSQRLEKSGTDGKDPPKEIAQEYEQLYSSIQAHPSYQKLVAAQANFDKLMLRVDEHIMEGMKQGAESKIITLG